MADVAKPTGLSPTQRPENRDTVACGPPELERESMGGPSQDDGSELPAANCEVPKLDSPPRQLHRETLPEQFSLRNTFPGTPSRQPVAGGLQYGSPWRTGPTTPLSAQLWRTIAPELTPDHSGYSGPGRIHITVPERLGRDRTVRFDHQGTTYSVTIPPDYSPGSRVEVELTAPLGRAPPPLPQGLDNGATPRQFGSPAMNTRRSFESPVMMDETASVQRIRRDVNRFREDLRATNAVKQHLKHQLELLQEESNLIDACLSSKAEIKRLNDELREQQDQVAAKKERALQASPAKSTPSSRPEATGQQPPSNCSPAASGLATDNEFLDEKGVHEASSPVQDPAYREASPSKDQAESIMPSVPSTSGPGSAQQSAVSPGLTSTAASATSSKVRTVSQDQVSASPRTSPQQPMSIQSPLLPASTDRVGSAISTSNYSGIASSIGVMPLQRGPVRTTPRSVTRDLITGTSTLPTFTSMYPRCARPSTGLPMAPSGMQLSSTSNTAANSMVPPPQQPTPQLKSRCLGGGASASFAMAPNGAMRNDATRAPSQDVGYPARTTPLVVQQGRSDSLSATNSHVRQQSDAVPQGPGAPLSKLAVVSPRLATRADAGNPDAIRLQLPGQPQQDWRQGVAHPARSTLHICRPSIGSVTIRPTGAGGLDQRVRTSSPGFRRDQSYRTSLPAGLSPSGGAVSSPRSCLGTAQPRVPTRSLPRQQPLQQLSSR